jgi:uncharacterized membrane protein YdbT with pleckstrin-like domain
MPEQTYLTFHPTRIAFLKWYLIAILFIAIGVFVIFSVYGLVGFSLPVPEDYKIYTLLIPFIGVIFILVADFSRKDDTYYITSHRIVERKGIFNIEEDSIEWEKISNYGLSQNMFDRIFNIGTIRLYSVGGAKDEEAEVVIRQVSNLQKIKALLDRLIERKR